MQISFSVAVACLNAAVKQRWHPPGTNNSLKLGQRHGNLGVAKSSVGVEFFPGKLWLSLLQGPA